MATCRSFEVIGRSYTDFDPTDQEHLKAAQLLCNPDLNEPVRQHSDIRFYLEQPYNDVRTMLLMKIAGEYFKVQGI